MEDVDALQATPAGILPARFSLLDAFGTPIPSDTDPAGGSPGLGAVRLRDQGTGKERWVLHHATPVRDQDGEMLLDISIYQDITELKEAEQAVRESRNRLALIYEHITESVSLVEVEADGGLRCVSVNAALIRSRGQAVETLVGKRLEEFTPPERLELVLGQYREAMRGMPVTFEYETVLRDQSRWLDVRIVPIMDSDGHCTHLLAVGRDITERRKAEEALRQTEEQFRQSQKMEAVGRLAGGVAHDFNNLLTAINGFSEMVLTGMDETSPWREYLVEIKAAGERAAGLTRQLLAYSRKQVLAPKILNMNTVVSDMDRMLRRVIGEDIEFETILASDLAPIRVDPSQMQQVLLNLAVNARDAMPAGGRLTVETSNIVIGQHPPESVRPGPYVLVAVSDTGKGMSAETKARLFEPFFTTKRVGEGTGLGLSTVYGIVQQSGGHVVVHSEPEHGAIFRLYFPAIPEAVVAVPGASPRREVPRGKETILLVEDEEAVRRLVSVVLKSAGYQVIEAENGVQALRVSDSHVGQIHLLLTDVVMPVMGGRELAEKLKAARPDTRIVFMSGYTDDAMLRHGVRESSAAFLQKPFSPARVAGVVRDVLDASDTPAAIRAL